MSGYALWNPSTTYIVNDIIVYDGIIYISIQGANLNHQPNSSPTWWATNGSGGVSSIVAGQGISVSGSTAITITNTGVRSLTAGRGITTTGTANDPTVIALLPVRNGTTRTLTYSGSPIVINNSVSSITNLLTIQLGVAYYSTIRNFTFYIGAFSNNAYTNRGTPVAFRIYPSTSASGAPDPDVGAMCQTILEAPNAGSPPAYTNTYNVIWNYLPASGIPTDRKLYINLQNYDTTAGTTLTITNFQMVYDLIGQDVSIE